VLACDLVVGASADALQTVRRGRTRILANEHGIPVADSVRNPDADLKREALLEKLRFAAGADRVETFDAQALAQDFLGDTVSANIVALGVAWQRGLVPVGLAALERAIELNGVAVQANLLAFALGRLAAADPAACERMRQGHADAPAPETLDEMIGRHAAHLTAYQDAAWAARYRRSVEAARAREAALGADPALPFTRAVATSLHRLMSYKDEYEVARLYTDGEFQRALGEQFEGELTLEFHMAPPLLARSEGGEPPRKLRFGPWLLTAMRWLARGRALRGTVLDPFGRTEERRTERALIGEYRACIEELLKTLSAENRALAVEIARIPEEIRGFGHVKQRHLKAAKEKEAKLLAAYRAPVTSRAAA
jgi:indolepyruvate ferredoxin oxidoreductase